MNQKYWLDLIYEGEKLTEAAEGTARDLSADIADTEAGRAATRTDAEKYRKLVNDTRYRDPNRPEHQLQDVTDAYRWNHPEAARAVPHGIGFSRPGR
ncbi:hypothetical protein [Gordonia sp. 852002-51296_SCH5728562-b]|uniref:hypothetical protein n=1 Tax=Gordonia sp. 852002-51296_SCH5728562-b TaxID=1834101 RepID=UPI0007EC009E|nr:hypothetical protein [Gordonia sp. 852002-51296_SCH5728562-b]OBA43992.1 hypothetical protein A5766_00120 [Gordonia sp. 852002-51296_SCH5728562-b]